MQLSDIRKRFSERRLEIERPWEDQLEHNAWKRDEVIEEIRRIKGRKMDMLIVDELTP